MAVHPDNAGPFFYVLREAVRILFVDDEPFVLEALQRMLHSMRHEWDMRFASGGAEALRMMAESPAEVVVSDMRMPDINGAQLLNEIMERWCLGKRRGQTRSGDARNDRLSDTQIRC